MAVFLHFCWTQSCKDFFFFYSATFAFTHWTYKHRPDRQTVHERHIQHECTGKELGPRQTAPLRNLNNDLTRLPKIEQIVHYIYSPARPVFLRCICNLFACTPLIWFTSYFKYYIAEVWQNRDPCQWAHIFKVFLKAFIGLNVTGQIMERHERWWKRGEDMQQRANWWFSFLNLFLSVWCSSVSFISFKSLNLWHFSFGAGPRSRRKYTGGWVRFIAAS